MKNSSGALAENSWVLGQWKVHQTSGWFPDVADNCLFESFFKVNLKVNSFFNQN